MEYYLSSPEETERFGKVLRPNLLKMEPTITPGLPIFASATRLNVLILNGIASWT